jgi:glycosyltransferase involved in cell wall biosynthesis
MYASIIIPAYNEENVITNNVNQVAEYLFRTLGPDKAFEILVVDDGSTDSTPRILDALAGERDYLTALHHPRNMGRGKGLRTGFEHASGQYVFTLDADLSYAPEHIGDMLAVLESGEADLVLASAYHQEGSVQNVPFKRALVSRWGNRLLSLSLGNELRTVTCVVRGYTARLLDSLELFSDGKDIHLETIQKTLMLGYKVAEVPARLHWRNTKRTSDGKGVSLGHFSKMASRHLFFNFLFRPSMLFWLPLVILGLIFCATSVMICYSYLVTLGAYPANDLSLQTLYFALRENLIGAKVTYFVWGFALILIFQFVSLTFIAKQSAYYYRELFSYFSRISTRIKHLERRGGE